MKVVRLAGTRTLKVFDEPMPTLSSDQVLLKVKAVGVCGSDLHRFRGYTFGDGDNTSMVLGHEFSATVLQIGENVTSVRPGDRVAVDAADSCGECEWCLKGQPNLCPYVNFCGLPDVEGALREVMAWPARLLYPLPESLDYDDGVLAEVMGIGLHSVDLAQMNPGQTVAVLGCGPIGLGVIELVRKTTGATLMVATDIIPERLQAAESFGADHVIHAEDESVVDRVMQITGGRGVDVVFEAAGVPDTLAQMIEIAAPGGNVVVIGIPEDDKIFFSAGPPRRKGLTLHFVRRSRFTYKRILTMMDKGIIDARPMITHHFPLDQCQRAFDLVDRYEEGAIKVIIDIE